MSAIRLGVICLMLYVLSGAYQPAQSSGKDKDLSGCSFKDIPLYGRIQFVTSFPDIKIQVVESFPDIDVQIVESFPDECGKWKIVESFPDFKVQVVESFPDIKVRYVKSFPGVK